MTTTTPRTSVPAAGGLWRCECGYLNLDPDHCTRCEEFGGPGATTVPSEVSGEPATGGDVLASAFPARSAGKVMAAFAGLVALANLAVQSGVGTFLRGHRLDVRLEAFALVGVLFYLATWVVASMLGRQVRVRPRGAKPTPSAIAFGLVSGGAVAAVLVAVATTSTGKPVLDPYAALLVTDGRLFPLITGIAIICIAAPLVEEYVFRGLLAQSLRTKGTALAVIASSIAFAVTHLNPTLVVYFTIMGAILCAIYLNAGLTASIVAHATINTSIVIVAMFVLSGDAHTVRVDGLRLTVPSTWDAKPGSQPGEDMVLARADGAAIEVVHAQAPADLDAEVIAGRMAGAGPIAGDVTFDPTSVRRRDLAVGKVVQIDVSGGGEEGTFVIVPNGREMVILVEHAPVGASGAGDDLESILTSAVRE